MIQANIRKGFFSGKWLSNLLRSIVLIGCFIQHARATGIQCNTTADCVNTLQRNGSFCMSTGYCSNPFHNGGCLAKVNEKISRNKNQSDIASNYNKYVRVCSSTDTKESEALGYCVPTNLRAFDYMEIRFESLNWESAFFETWIAQILLSEILGVPTSVETGFPDKSVDFYDIQSRFDYGNSYDWEAFRLAHEVNDCRNLDRSLDTSKYRPCAHVSLEIWQGQTQNLNDLLSEGTIDKPAPLGALGHISWFIPRFTGERDPTLMSYLGLAGEKNRQKLADRFLRPTKWIDYCTQVSASNCTVPDKVANRPPKNKEEETKMFLENVYTGFFRKTEKNDCVANPHNCTGHMADFPCGWDSFMKQQAYHLEIAVESDGDEPESQGYSYSQMTEIWAAANATKSDVMMLWWTPEALYQQYAGTDSEFLRVSLPPSSQKCIDARANPSDRCSGIPEKVYGSPDGACDEDPYALVKVISKNIQESSYSSTLSEAERSPAYDTILNMQISTSQLGVIFQKWLSKNFDKWNYDPRDATCEWVIENIDLVTSFAPRTYPRLVQEGENSFEEPMFYASSIVSILSMILVVGVSFATYFYRYKSAIVIAQIEFLILVLFGLLLSQIGSVLLSLPPSDATCVTVSWMYNLGFTLELVPLLVKIAAINRLMAAAKNKRRVRINSKKLLAIVAAFTLPMAFYLTLWTVLSPPQKVTHYDLTTDMTEGGETIVKSYQFCQSSNQIWKIIALGWRCILLFCSTILAFLSRNCPVKVNESKTLALIVYAKFIFLLLLVMLLVLSNQIRSSQILRVESFIQSLDSMAVCLIYFIPKLCMNDDDVAANMADVQSSVIRSASVNNNSKESIVSPPKETVPESAPEKEQDENNQCEPRQRTSSKVFSNYDIISKQLFSFAAEYPSSDDDGGFQQELDNLDDCFEIDSTNSTEST